MVGEPVCEHDHRGRVCDLSARYRVWSGNPTTGSHTSMLACALHLDIARSRVRERTGIRPVVSARIRVERVARIDVLAQGGTS